ncbi:POLYOL TRANSPORTER 5, ARABIDOPSIS THALIANA POLYOL/MONOSACCHARIDE TRANSPORTER 5 [Hibiscus trionum]|uniref:POLYOL TRANSPORTER 5, ARABIDOPSIS THALIANA POLYOL/MONOSACCHARIDE TRANSPORTER 5 n=1 Tax=Hibiscus trionum TaxID=183268 RepID=A0A9W7MQE2_HIBTR|nr:POLYOL TRANSPORTER 5, ARABIDOPSIS THALIANA POLYOL/MONOSACCHARIDE TRANSPORTER 5 [Hibiscus trionum]
MAGFGPESGAVPSQPPETPAVFEVSKKPKKNKFAYACAMLASLTSMLLGYDIGVMSGAIMFIKEDLRINDVQIEILVGVLNLYCLVGSIVAGKVADSIGRRYTMVLANVIIFVGSLFMGFSVNYAFLMVGRFVAGIGVGFAIMSAVLYNAEISPASSRGFLTSFPEVCINVGILLGYVSNYAFSKLPLSTGWRMMLGIGAIPSVFLVFAVLAMPESPRWLVMQGRLGEAKIVLEKTLDTKEEAQLRLNDIKEAAGIPQDCTGDVVVVPEQGHGKGVWRDLFLHPTAAVKHVLICAVGIHFFQQASGVDAVVVYSPRIFEKAGITSTNDKLLATVAVGFCKTIFILVATFLLDKVGRRALLLFSVGGMVASLAALGFSLTIINHSEAKLTWAIALCITTVLAYVAFFAIGMGPITGVYMSEIFPLRLRAVGVSMGVAVNRVISGVISMTFISLYGAITIGGAFFLFAGIAAVGWVFFYVCLPETRGKTLEETEKLFGKVVGWREVARKMKEVSINGTTKRQTPLIINT